MIKVYYRHANINNRIMSYMSSKGVPYEARDISRDKLSAEEVKDLLWRSIDGTREVFVMKRFKEKKKLDLSKVKLSELIDMARNDPYYIKTPIIFDDTNFIVGGDWEEIRDLVKKHEGK